MDLRRTFYRPRLEATSLCKADMLLCSQKEGRLGWILGVDVGYMKPASGMLAAHPKLDRGVGVES